MSGVGAARRVTGYTGLFWDDMRGPSHGQTPVLKQSLPLLLALAWLWLFRSTLSWIRGAIALKLTVALSSVMPLLGLALILLLPLVHAPARAGLLAALRQGPRAVAWVLPVSFGVAVAAQISERILGVHTLTALLFVMGSYVLLRLYLPPGRWHQGAPLLALLLILLPVPARDHLDALIGFPARVATARFVHDLLTSLHIRSVSAEAIIVLENGIAHVDLPCSGVKGLWTGALFFFAATWLLRRRMDLRWLLSGVLLALLILFANAVRVVVLVLLIFVAEKPQIAESLHVPLGALGFVGSCALVLVFIRTGVSTSQGSADRDEPSLPARPLMLFILALIAMSFTPRTAPAPGQPSSTAPLILPADLTVAPLEMTPGEQALIFDHDGVLARKWQFQSRSTPALTGSFLIVESRSFRAHHAPEVCLAAGGLKVSDMRRAELPGPPPFPLRVINATSPDSSGRRTAVYWFQSRHETSDSLLVRTLSTFSLDRGRRQASWALVTVLFDSPADATDAATQALLTAVHASVDVHLKGAHP